MYIKAFPEYLVLSKNKLDVNVFENYVNILTYSEDKLILLTYDVNLDVVANIKQVEVDNPNLLCLTPLPSCVYDNKHIISLFDMELNKLQDVEYYKISPIDTCNGLILYEDGTIQWNSIGLFTNLLDNIKNVSIRYFGKGNFLLINYKNEDKIYSSELLYFHNNNTLVRIGYSEPVPNSYECQIIADSLMVYLVDSFEDENDFEEIQLDYSKDLDTDLVFVSNSVIVRKFNELTKNSSKRKKVNLLVNGCKLVVKRLEVIIEEIDGSNILFVPSKRIVKNGTTYIVSDTEFPYAIELKDKNISFGILIDELEVNEKCLKDLRN